MKLDTLSKCHGPIMPLNATEIGKCIESPVHAVWHKSTTLRFAKLNTPLASRALDTSLLKI